MCHIVFGLSPRSKQEEGRIVRGWLERERRRGYCQGQTWYLISRWWWRRWESWIDFIDDESQVWLIFFGKNGSVCQSYLYFFFFSVQPLSSQLAGPAHQPLSRKQALNYLSMARTRPQSTIEFCWSQIPQIIRNSSHRRIWQSYPIKFAIFFFFLISREDYLFFQPKQNAANAVNRSPKPSGRSWSPCPRVVQLNAASLMSSQCQDDVVTERPGPIDNTSLVIGGKDDKASSSTTYQKVIF